MAFKKLVSMELDDEEKFDAPQPIAMSNKPDYPYGLRVCLTHRELAKMGLGANCDVGDHLMLMVDACVTCVSQSDGPGGPESRVELQIEKMGEIGDE